MNYYWIDDIDRNLYIQFNIPIYNKVEKFDENFNDRLCLPTFSENELDTIIIYFDYYGHIFWTIRDELNFYKKLETVRNKFNEIINEKYKQLINEIKQKIDDYEYED